MARRAARVRARRRQPAPRPERRPRLQRRRPGRERAPGRPGGQPARRRRRGRPRPARSAPTGDGPRPGARPARRGRPAVRRGLRRHARSSCASSATRRASTRRRGPASSPASPASTTPTRRRPPPSWSCARPTATPTRWPRRSSRCCPDRSLEAYRASGLYLMRWGWSALGAELLVAPRLVVAEVALEPAHLAVALEGEDVGGDPVEEPPVVADDDRAAGERLERVLQGAQRVDVEVVGRLVEQQDVRRLLAASWPGGPGCARRPTSSPTCFCWSEPLKLNEAT